MKPSTNQFLAVHVSRVTILWNIALSIFKFLAGIAAHSSAMVSDAVHSASDVFSTLIVIVGVRAAGKAADEEHPYGHERMECVAALLLSSVLFMTGAAIGLSAMEKVYLSRENSLTAPGLLALAAAVISVVVKEAMYHYTKHAAVKLNSGALMADAWHHRSDALSSVGSFIGILGARLGFPLLDPAAGIVICIFILKAAVSIFVDSVNKMVDKACDCQTVGAIAAKILELPGVLGIDRLSTRLFGDRVYVEVEVRADGKVTLTEAHKIAHQVHDAIEETFPKVKHCMVHMNPAEDDAKGDESVAEKQTESDRKTESQ